MELITKLEKRSFIRVIFILILPSIFLILSFIGTSYSEISAGLYEIITSPSILLTDYLAVGGLNSALLNSALCGFISCLIIIFFKIDIDGPFVAAIYTVMGFAFLGKNIYNIWGIFAGVYIFAKLQRVSFKNYVLVALFGTTLSPLISFMTYGLDIPLYFSYVLGLLLGIFAGFVLPSLATQMLKIHNGFNIYNIGFTGGITGSFIIAVLRSFRYEFQTESLITHSYSSYFFRLFTVYFLFLIILGIIISVKLKEKKIMYSLKKIYKSSGRLISDFTIIGSFGSTLVNMGIMGLISLLFVFIIKAEISGPVIAGVLTVVGFSAFGKHAFNCVPVMIGVYLASLVKVWGGNIDIVVITGLFATTLAPISGQYGIFAGMTAGFFHLSIVTNVGILHGGINLYNNGFAGGFVASFLVPVFNSLIKGRNNRK